MRDYVDLRKVFDNESLGTASIQKFEASGFQAFKQGIPEGEYVRLVINDTLYMSNTPMEMRTSRDFVRNAHGDVLILGLGLGMVIFPLLSDERITSILVVENNKDVIDLVYPKIHKQDLQNKVTVISEDAFEFTTSLRFDTIFIDIWSSISQDIYEEEMKPLKARYKKFLKKGLGIKKNMFVWAEHNARYDIPLV